MFGAFLTPAFLLLASARAQETSEGILTVQTSVPPLNTPCVGDECLIASTSVCMENCIMEPCFPCSSPTSDFQMSIPEGETPIFTSDLASSSLVVTATTPEMSIPGGETPISTTTGPSPSGPTSGVTSSSQQSSGASSGTPSSSGTAPPEQSTGAASPGPKGDGSSYLFAVALSGMSMMFGAAWVLL